MVVGMLREPSAASSSTKSAVIASLTAARVSDSIANQSKQHKAFPLLIKSVPPQNLSGLCRRAAILCQALA